MTAPKKPATFGIQYVENDAQRRLAQAIADGAKVVLFVGGIRSGKSVGGVAELLRAFYTHKKKPKLGWVISPTFTMMDAPEAIFKNFVYSDHGTIVLARQIAKRKYILKPTADAPRVPIEIEFKSATEPDRLRGASVGFIVMDEGAMMSEETFNICLGRVMDNDGIILICTTPRGKNWVFNRVYQRSLHDPQYVTIRGRSDENTYLNPDFIKRKREELANPSLIKRELEGEFTSFEGAVFPAFDPATHIVSTPRLRDDTEVYCGIDWGFNDPFVCVWCARIDGVWVVLDEYYRTQTLLADHVAVLKSHPLAHRVKRYWCDPSALQERREFQRMGIKTMPARRPDGNRAVSWPVMRARLMNALFAKRVSSPWDEDKSKLVPGMVYTEECVNGLRETSNLMFTRFMEKIEDPETGKIISVRVTDKEGSEVDRNATEEIEDRNNHFVDALGYCIFSEERFGGAKIHYKDEAGRVITKAPQRDLRQQAIESMRQAIEWAHKPKPKKLDSHDTLS